MVTYVIFQGKQFKNLHLITLGLLYAILGFFFLLNGEALFSEWNSSWTYSTLIYIVGVAIFLSIYERIPEDTKEPISKSMFAFLISFPMFSLVFILMADFGIWFDNSTTQPFYLIIPVLVYQICIVATSEEIIFRGAIFGSLLKINWIMAYVVSAGLFGIFHLNAYGGNWILIVVAFAMGLILAYVVDRWNIGASIGLHASYNTCAVGAIVFNIGTGMTLTMMVVFLLVIVGIIIFAEIFSKKRGTKL